jgi:hypothetical protein
MYSIMMDLYSLKTVVWLNFTVLPAALAGSNEQTIKPYFLTKKPF